MQMQTIKNGYLKLNYLKLTLKVKFYFMTHCSEIRFVDIIFE